MFRKVNILQEFGCIRAQYVFISSEQDDESFSEIEKVSTYKKEQEMNLAKMSHFE